MNSNNRLRSIYINAPKENWVVDRFRKEWIKYNSQISRSIYSPKVKIIWIIAPWTWQKLNLNTLKKKIVICTIHHIDEDKFGEKERNDFYERDKVVTAYHAISKNTKLQLEKLTEKKIFTMPFWVNQNIFHSISDKDSLRRKYLIDKNARIIGSFQRDTEGTDLKSPKLSKGPDRFISIVDEMYKRNNKIEVLLTGKRRQYLMSELKKRQIKFHYFEMVNFETLNELYNIVDLYLVTSRYEGGPQSILECGIIKTPILSTDVGVASEILNKSSIFNDDNYAFAKENIEHAYDNVSKLTIPQGFDSFNKMFREYL
jgi:glycosyltransferase involved in cell wall biosynthesis